MSETTKPEVKKRQSKVKPLSTKQLDLLYDLYYNQKLTFGRDKLFNYLQQNHPNEGISRRNLDSWLKSQESHMVHRRAKSIRDTRATVAKKPYQVLQIDLANLQNFETDGFKYIMVGVDMFDGKVIKVII